ncbi:MAG: hypothetical protein Q8K37_08110 [Alphaproteobacteria bacterium]|nr:hypothetical protein [Alphaproteobacteria bacterium]
MRIFVLLLFLFSYEAEALVEVNDKSLLEEGLTEKTIGNFLYKNKKDCYRVEEQKNSSGLELEKLFYTYTQKCSTQKNTKSGEFFNVIKVLKNGLKEIENLEYIKKSNVFNKKYTDSPNVILPDENYFLKKNNINTYFSVMQAAQGKSLKDIIDEKNIDKIAEAFGQFGKQIAHLHLKFMDLNTIPKENNPIPDPLKTFLTLIHSDLHWENALYDEKTYKINLIDNEGFARSLKDTKKSIATDIFKASAKSMKKIAPSLTEVAMLNFLQNYIQSYPKEYQNTLYRYLENLINSDPKFQLEYKKNSNVEIVLKKIIFKLNTSFVL